MLLDRRSGDRQCEIEVLPHVRELEFMEVPIDSGILDARRVLSGVDETGYGRSRGNIRAARCCREIIIVPRASGNIEHVEMLIYAGVADSQQILNTVDKVGDG